jgi:hypothetical protein
MSPFPDLHSRFMEFLVARNHSRMDGFRRWMFQPGMGFQSSEKWWGDRGRRAAPHEGLDLAIYEAASGTVKTMDQYIQIPAAFFGRIVKIVPDFLGKSIFMLHEIYQAEGMRLWSAFGHTVPAASLVIGQDIEAGEIIGTIAAPAGLKPTLPPHLHLTFAWVPVDVSPDLLTWKNLGRDPGITLIDPLAVILPVDRTVCGEMRI